MFIFLAFFLFTPFPTVEASVREKTNSTIAAPHTITALNTKQKSPTHSPATKIRDVSQILFSTTVPPETPSVKKTTKDKPPSVSPIKVVITEGCIQKEPQKDTVNSSKLHETELSLKPGSLVMTHHISLVPGSCTGGCEAEMAALKDRVAILEKEMSTLKKKCTLCSGGQCPSNCNKNGRCVNGKCVCQAGFTGIDCSKGATKENEVFSDSSTVKQEISSQKQPKANNTVVHRKDTEESYPDQERGPTTIEKIPLNKDLYHNVPESTKKKSDGMLKAIIKSPKSSKDSGIASVQTNTEQDNLSLHNVTSAENNKKSSQDSVMKVLKGQVSSIQKVEKHTHETDDLKVKDRKHHKGHEKNTLEKHLNVTTSTEKIKTPIKKILIHKRGSSEKKIVGGNFNVTSSTEKDKKPSKDNVVISKEGTEKKLVEKHSNVTTAIEKDKKLSQGNATQPKEESTDKKLVEKLSNVTMSTEKDRTLHQNNNLPKDGSTGKKKLDRFLNTTAANNKDNTFPEDDKTVAHKKTTSGNKKGETHVNGTAAATTEKDKKLNQGNVPPLKETTLGKTKVEKHLNLTNSTEKDKKNLSNVPPLKEKTSGMRNVTTSSEKRKKIVAGNETKIRKVTLETKTAQKHVNISSSAGKDKLHQGNATLLNGELSRKTKLDSHLIVTPSTEKDKKLPQSNETTFLNDVTAEKKKVEKQLNVITFTDKDKKLSRSNSTLIKEGSSQKGKVDSINVKKSSDKGKKFLQGDETTILTTVISGTGEKDVNVTTVSEKDRSLQQILKEDATKKNPVNSEKASKLTGISQVEVQNITATGFVITWEAPQGLFRNFTVTRREVWSGRSTEDDDTEGAEKRQDGDIKADEFYNPNRTTSTADTEKADRKSAETFSQILAGSARSYQFRNLRPQRKYLVSLFGSGPHVRSKVHRLFVSTGPEPPTELLFSNITETSLIVSWTKPKSTITGFKVTYTNSANEVAGSMSVDSKLSQVLISKLTVGSRYEISVRSVMGATASEATTASVVTVPDSPTDFQAVNVTDSKALLVWKPAQAKVDHYILSYGSTRSPNVTVTVMLSGNSVMHQLRGLHRSTLYSVKIISQINSLQSSSVSTTFTTKSGVKLQIVTPSEVTWNSALISWKSTSLSFKTYRLTYQFGEEVKEVILNPTMTQYELSDLVASSHYTVKVDGESDGQYINVVSTAFTTAPLPYPYPNDCSQVQTNGMKKSGEAEIFPEGKDGEAVWVYCDMETDGGGWTVFQRRVDGATDFFRDWKDYSQGFGETSAGFWLGNDILHILTSVEPMSLRIDLRLGNDTAYAHYSNFSVGPEVNHYTIDLSGYSGTAGDSMKYHNGCPFSTKDKGPSTNSIYCAKNYMGGWWYKNCYKANLNGLYATFSNDQGVVWIDWMGKDISIPYTEMKLRPASLSHLTLNTQG